MARVAFLQNIWTDNLGLMWILSALKENGHVSEIFVCGNKKIPNDLKHFSPDIVGFSVMTGMQIWALQMAKFIKRELNPLIIFGGPYFHIAGSAAKAFESESVCRRDEGRL